MIYLTYATIPGAASVKELFQKVKNNFPNSENADYLAEIMSRNNETGIKESFSALLLLSQLIQKTDIDISSLVFARNINGKPYFKSSPLHFSLAHSKGYAAAAISDTSEVGLDLECSEISFEKSQKLAARWFNEKEFQDFVASPDSFLRIWTKKEAYAKMLGITLAETVLKDNSMACRSSQTQKKLNYSFFEVKKHPITVCFEGMEQNTIVFETNLETIK